MNNRRLLTAVSFIAFMATGVTNPVNSLYYASLGAGYSAIGLLGTVTALTSILFSFVLGRASDRVGKRKAFLIAGLLASAVSNGLIAFVPTHLYLFPLRILSGAALSAYATSLLAMMGDELEEHGATRGRRMGTFRGLSSLGFGLMAFFSGGIADRFTLRTPYLLSSLFFVMAFLFAVMVKESRSASSSTAARENPFLALAALVRQEGRIDETTGPTAAEADVPRSGRLPLQPLLISAFIWSLTIGAVYAVWANYMVNELGYTATIMSRLWSVAATAEFPLMILAGWLSDRIGRLKMLALGFLACTLVYAGYVLIPGMPWIVFIQLVRGFAYSGFTAASMTYAAEARSRSQRGSVSGAYHAAGGIGSIIGAAAGGIQTQLMGFQAMIATNAALIFAGAVYLIGVVTKRRYRR